MKHVTTQITTDRDLTIIVQYNDDPAGAHYNLTAVDREGDVHSELKRATYEEAREYMIDLWAIEYDVETADEVQALFDRGTIKLIEL